MINREIDSFLKEFFEKHTEALLITGARQIGKTSSIRMFGKTEFKNFLEINFIENPEAKTIFAGAKGAADVLLRLSAYSRVPLEKGKTLIFFDEIQECPEAVTAIKFLVEDGRFRYVMSGSLLGVELKDIRSIPVGYLFVKEMFPLNLMEFCRALGIGENVLQSLKSAYANRVPVDEFIHGKMMEIFRLYLIVGGMPAAVREYLETNNLQDVMAVQRGILALYKKDIAKYDPKNKLYLEEIFNLIPAELNAQNKRFVLKNLNENFKFSRYENSFIWLKEAGVALPTFNVDEPRVPLLLSRSRNLFKLFQNDVGLLACQYAGSLQLKILNGDDRVNCGAVFENFVAEELYSHGIPLYYFNSKKQGELDFVVEIDGAVLPIEVKSGKDYARHNALSNVMACENYGIPMAVVLCNENTRSSGNVVYFPIYMLMFLQNESVVPGKFSLDLSSLKD